MLMRLRNKPPFVLDELGKQVRDFVLREKNYRKQGAKIRQFLNQINHLNI